MVCRKNIWKAVWEVGKMESVHYCLWMLNCCFILLCLCLLFVEDILCWRRRLVTLAAQWYTALQLSQVHLIVIFTFCLR